MILLIIQLFALIKSQYFGWRPTDGERCDNSGIDFTSNDNFDTQYRYNQFCWNNGSHEGIGTCYSPGSQPYQESDYVVTNTYDCRNSYTFAPGQEQPVVCHTGTYNCGTSSDTGASACCRILYPPPSIWEYIGMGALYVVVFGGVPALILIPPICCCCCCCLAVCLVGVLVCCGLAKVATGSKAKQNDFDDVVSEGMELENSGGDGGSGNQFNGSGNQFNGSGGNQFSGSGGNQFGGVNQFGGQKQFGGNNNFQNNSGGGSGGGGGNKEVWFQPPIIKL